MIASTTRRCSQASIPVHAAACQAGAHLGVASLGASGTWVAISLARMSMAIPIGARGSSVLGQRRSAGRCVGLQSDGTEVIPVCWPLTLPCQPRSTDRAPSAGRFTMGHSDIVLDALSGNFASIDFGDRLVRECCHAGERPAWLRAAWMLEVNLPCVLR